MVSRRELLSVQRRRWASKQRDQGTFRSLVYSATIRSNPSQESGLEVLKKNHDESGEAHASKAFHGFKRIMRIESLNRNVSLSIEEACTHSFWYLLLELG
jgi:hypothetical protein